MRLCSSPYHAVAFSQNTLFDCPSLDQCFSMYSRCFGVKIILRWQRSDGTGIAK